MAVDSLAGEGTVGGMAMATEGASAAKVVEEMALD
jgi:hypothetical protein